MQICFYFEEVMESSTLISFLPAQPSRKAELLTSLLSHLLTEGDMRETVLKIMASKDRFEQDQAVIE